MRQSKADGLVLPTLISSLFRDASFYVRIMSFVEVCEYPSVEQYLLKTYDLKTLLKGSFL